jgi:L-seryl-tRNA(Ser) seleniumtransferase
MQSMPSPLVAIEGRPGRSATHVESGLRSYDPPVVARIEKDRVLLDLRTVPEDQEDDLVAAVIQATRPRQTGA